MAKKEEKVSRAPTRRQKALSKREQEQQKMIYLGLGLVAVLVIAVLAIGLYQTYVAEPGAPVASVNGQEISTGEYQDRVLYERFVLDDQIAQIRQELDSLPPAEEGDQFSELLRNQYQQVAGQILQQRSSVDRQTLDEMTLDILVQAEAENRGISVTEDEITEAINRLLAGRQGGLTAAAVEETATARAEASATAALWTPTPTLTPSPTLTTTQTLTEPTATPANTPTRAPTPTPNIIDQTELSTAYTGWIDTISQQTGISEDQYRTYIRAGLFTTKLAEALGEEVSTVAEQAHARHILVESEEEANDVIGRLETGEEFADLALELSTDTGSAASGGDLGFAARGRFVEPIEEAIFSLPIGEISEPIQTQFGWHIVEVLEREERELSPVDYTQQQRQAFVEWTNAARQNATVEDFWTPDKAPEDLFLGQGQ